jgi:tRNA(fMet)-specific endonuclease VapC
LILGTTARSAMADGEPELEPIVRGASELILPVIVLGEYRFGIAESRVRPRYERWLTELVSACRILRIDEATATHYARIRGELKQSGRPIPSNDSWIAALARQHSLSVISRDRHFDYVRGIRRIEW